MKSYRLREDKSLEEITGNFEAIGASFGASRTVGNTKWPLPDGKTLVLSTVFLVYDHDGDLFETMAHIEDGSFGEGQIRYPSWEEALAGHQRLAALIVTAIESCKTVGAALGVADGILGTE